MTPYKKVAIVGGGASGLAAVKALKEESIEPVCYEKSPDVGGTWCYRNKNAGYDGATVMSTTTLLQSKEIGAISNYPFPENAPNYMRHDEVYKYFLEACDAFDLLKHVICNKEVISVKRTENYDETGRWDVTVRNTKTQETFTETFDAVIMCTGNNGSPNMPSYPGMDKFRGKIMHSQKVWTFESFAGKSIVVVGTGCSAVDAAVEISSVSKKVYWSVRTPSWIISRVGPYGLPVDYVVFRRYIVFLQDILPISWVSKLIQHFFIYPRFNHEFFGIHPEYPVLCRDPVVNDLIPTKLLNGSVVLRKNIKEIVEDGVIFEGESEVTKADTIIMGTGYKFEIPCLEKGILIAEEKGKILLYKGVFPPHLKHPTIAFLSYILPFGPGFPVGELQSRWIAHVFSGKGSLPAEKDMRTEIENRQLANVRRYSPSEKMSQRVDCLPYMDDLATEIGAKPNFWKMAFTDPRLFIACIFGPFASYQYRLIGPHPWEGARKAILTVSKRVQAPVEQEKGSALMWELKANHIFFKVLLMILLSILLFLPVDDQTIPQFFPILLAIHLALVGCTGGKTITYWFFLICSASWYFFPSIIKYLVIIEAAFVLMCN